MAAAKNDGPLSLEEYQAKQAADWGKYVATDVIYVGGVRAFAAGHAVPASYIDSGLVSKDQVTTTAPATEKDA